MNPPDSTSTRPYLIRALYEWCTDNGFTPYVAVSVDETVQVPREYVKNNEIVLNIGFDATSSLKLGNEFIEFKARFAGSAREIMVPINNVIAIYARENGQGMAFPMGNSIAAPAALAPSRVDAGPIAPAVASVGDAPSAVGPTDLAENKIMQLVPERAPEAVDDGSGPPEPSPSTPRTRPFLKRVK